MPMRGCLEVSGGVSCVLLVAIGAMPRTRFRQSCAGDGEDLAADDEVQTGCDLGLVTRRRLGDREACQDQRRGEGWEQHCGSFCRTSVWR